MFNKSSFILYQGLPRILVDPGTESIRHFPVACTAACTTRHTPDPATHETHWTVGHGEHFHTQLNSSGLYDIVRGHRPV